MDQQFLLEPMPWQLAAQTQVEGFGVLSEDQQKQGFVQTELLPNTEEIEVVSSRMHFSELTMHHVLAPRRSVAQSSLDELPSSVQPNFNQQPHAVGTSLVDLSDAFLSSLSAEQMLQYFTQTQQ